MKKVILLLLLLIINYKISFRNSVYPNWYIKSVLRKYPIFNYDLDNIMKNSYVIPGLKKTISLRNNKLDPCKAMTVQGITVTKKYILISAYCYYKNHNSVIYLIDKKSHKYLKTIILKDKSHLSSLTYDQKYDNIWISTYQDGPSISMIKLDKLVNAKRIIDFDKTYKIVTQRRVSSISYNDNKLYIGYFDKNKKSNIQIFNLYNGYPKIKLKNNIILPDNAFSIQNKVQGFIIDENILVFSKSYGIEKSEFKVFDNKELTHFEAMPMAEDMAIYQNKIYLIFESASLPYRYRFIDHMDRIIVLEED